METVLKRRKIFETLHLSETHYSLKEMETINQNFLLVIPAILSETHYSLKEMETSSYAALILCTPTICRKPTTL